MYNHFFLQADQPIRLQYSHQIKLFCYGTDCSSSKSNCHDHSIPRNNSIVFLIKPFITAFCTSHTPISICFTQICIISFPCSPWAQRSDHTWLIVIGQSSYTPTILYTILNILLAMSEWGIVVQLSVIKVFQLHILMPEQVTFWWDDDDVHFVQDQYA